MTLSSRGYTNVSEPSARTGGLLDRYVPMVAWIHDDMRDSLGINGMRESVGDGHIFVRDQGDVTAEDGRDVNRCQNRTIESAVPCGLVLAFSGNS